ncbi:MAG: Gfo/Idh/MocA family oxidoreductase [Solirubrobacteraceae bacterium]
MATYLAEHERQGTGTDERLPVGMAVVGAGYWGPNIVRNALQCPETRLITVCDAALERAEKLAGSFSGVKATADLQELLDNPEVEAIAVVTPPGTHLEVAMAAIEAGKHVLVEKPLAATYAEGRALVNAAEDKGVVLMCDHTYCYTPAVERIRELLHSGVLGDLQFADSVRINLGLVQRDVNVLWDLAPHDLSILDFILPEGCHPLAVAAHGADPIGAGQECVAYLTLQLPQGAIAHLHVNWLSPIKVRTTTIGGSKRTLVWDDLNPSQRISVFDRGVDLADPAQLGADDRRQALVSYRSGDMVAPALPEREALQGVMSEFADCIRTGRTSRTDGRAGLRVLDILEAASRSLEFHGAVVPLRSDR